MTEPGPQAQTDAHLVALAQGGDRNALDALLRNHLGSMHRFARRMCGDADRAQDVVQDALVNVVRGLDGFRGDSAFSSWLFMVVRRACLRSVRRKSHQPAHMDNLDGPTQHAAEGPLPSDHAAAREMTRVLEAALLQLPPRAREVILLRDVEGLSARDVADSLGLEVPAVKSRLHRARAQLRDAVSAMTHAEPPPPPTPQCKDVVQLFSRYLEGDLSPAVCQRMQTHVDGCARCGPQCQALKDVLGQCAALPAQASAQQLAKMRAAIQQVVDGGATPGVKRRQTRRADAETP